MATTWNITVTTSAFTATVVHNDDGSWSWQLNPPNGRTGTFPTTFAFTSAFKMGANDEYEFGAGTASGESYTGSVSYPSAAAVTTTWTATKKSLVHKHEAA